jgi:hypothetical protein
MDRSNKQKARGECIEGIQISGVVEDSLGYPIGGLVFAPYHFSL